MALKQPTLLSKKAPALAVAREVPGLLKGSVVAYRASNPGPVRMRARAGPPDTCRYQELTPMNATDLKSRSLADAQTDKVVRVLGAVAHHLTVSRPEAKLGPDALSVVVSSKAYEICPRMGARLLADAAMKAAPVGDHGITRGEYALRLRRTITEAGYEWSDEDNKPVIPPIVPAPRKPMDGGR
ncbi:hypothetical protein [Embleya sp. NPDC001921]